MVRLGKDQAYSGERSRAGVHDSVGLINEYSHPQHERQPFNVATHNSITIRQVCRLSTALTPELSGHQMAPSWSSLIRSNATTDRFDIAAAKGRT